MRQGARVMRRTIRGVAAPFTFATMLGAPRSGARPPTRLVVVGPECVRQIPVRDVPSERGACKAGEAVVQASPDACVRDFCDQVVAPEEVMNGVEVPRRPGGIEAGDVEVDVRRAEHACE